MQLRAKSEKPEMLSKAPRTVEERIELKHAAGRLKFKRWRRFVNQEQEPSPLTETREEEEESSLEEESDSEPPSDDEDDGQSIRNGIVRTVSFHDDQDQDLEGDDSKNVGGEVGQDHTQNPDDGGRHQIRDEASLLCEEFGRHIDMHTEHEPVGEIDPAIRCKERMERGSNCDDRQANLECCSSGRTGNDSLTRRIGSIRQGGGGAYEDRLINGRVGAISSSARTRRGIQGETLQAVGWDEGIPKKRKT
jgi:hypothetical protein